RDKDGKEIVNTDIEVRFTILSGSPTGTEVYQEVFTDVITSRYGVFSLVIGDGDPVIGTFAGIDWSTANHYLQVSVKFENNFMDMGTMQFMAVPYALYAGKSLEPGPMGPAGPKGDKGDPGDPSIDTDDQKLSYNASDKILSLTDGGSVRLDTIVAFRARNLISDIAPQISDITMTYDTPDLSFGGGFNACTGIFIVPADGIYTFNVAYTADGVGSGREVTIYVNSAPYEKIAVDISTGTIITVRSVTIRLSKGNTVSVVIYTGTATQTGTGSFAGYKVN
ncbi:MAG: collagen-like protein, partial [Bacteroidales bacterium]